MDFIIILLPSFEHFFNVELVNQLQILNISLINFKKTT